MNLQEIKKQHQELTARTSVSTGTATKRQIEALLESNKAIIEHRDKDNALLLQIINHPDATDAEKQKAQKDIDQNNESANKAMMSTAQLSTTLKQLTDVINKANLG